MDENNALISDIQRRTERMDNMLSKLDTSLEKLNEISSLLAVHSEKFSSQDKLNNYFYDVLDQRKSELEKSIHEVTVSFKEMREESRKAQEKTDNKFSVLNRLIYMAAGGGFVLGYLLQNYPTIIEFLTHGHG